MLNKVNHNRILVISYYACMPGACQAEWLDDKLDSLLEAGFKVALTSAACSKRYANEDVFHSRIASISLKDFRDEMQRIRAAGDSVRICDYLMLPITLSLGLLMDIMQSIVTKGVGEGRWSWTITSFFASLFLSFRFKPTVILSTGGPASAHLSGILLSKLFGVPLIVELQDPLSGSDIGRNAQARGWLYRVEKLIVNSADKIVYVTNEAANFAANQFESSKVTCVYPGAKDFGIKRNPANDGSSFKFRLVHLGSLYATRNFKSIVAAIDTLISSNRLNANDIELINLGHVAPHIRDEIIQKEYVKILAPVSREKALQFAAECDATLLIQNSDERSKVTIPYKTYDYLNIDTPILALLNSDELSQLISECGHIALPLSDIQAITHHLGRLIDKSYSMGRAEKKIDAVQQSLFLMNLDG